MSGRDQVLGAIRRSLAVADEDSSRRARITSRLKLSARRFGLRPGRGEPATDRLCAKAEAVQASVTRVADRAAVPGAIAEYLRGANLPQQIRTGDDPRLAGLPWESVPHLDRTCGPSAGGDPVGVTYAFAGVAESGTLVMVSGADNPTTLNLLPDTHIVVLDAADIVDDYETVWQRLRDRYGKGVMPRTVNFITGPSRSADIEQTLFLGAHGPRALHVVVVDGAGTGTSPQEV